MSTLAQSEFDRIAELALDRWGLHFTEKKRELVTNRLQSFLRKNPGYGSTDQYILHLEKEAAEEDLLVFFDLLSTNVTSFFRERAHFDYLEREFYTALSCGNLTTPGRRIRIWSAACSDGSEPYTIAIHAHEHLRDIADWDLKILATDLSNTVVEKARAGLYPMDAVQKLDTALLRKYFLRGRGDQSGFVKVKPEIREMVSIGRHNLMEPFPCRGPFDIIFCRNVMIYFNKSTRERLVSRFYDVLRPGGLLIVGSAETLSRLNTRFKTVQASVYMK